MNIGKNFSRSNYELLIKYRLTRFVCSSRCCYMCVSEKEIEWRTRIQEHFLVECVDEKFNFMKYLQRCLANLPLSLHHLLCAINQHQSQYNKQAVCSFLVLLVYESMFGYSRYSLNYFTNICSIERLIVRRFIIYS